MKILFLHGWQSLPGGVKPTFLAQHGLWAVFILMFVDAMFPAASELVMVYGGALASGALAHQLVVFGTERSGFDAYVWISLAGTIGYLLGAIVGWAIGLYGGRPFLERRGRWFHLSHERLERAERWFERWEDWDHRPFTHESTRHVSVWQKPG